MLRFKTTLVQIQPLLNSMSPIHPEIFRVGKTSRWSSDIWSSDKSSALTGATIKSILNGYLGDIFNLFVVKCEITGQTQSGVIQVSVVFYKYIQRARVIKSRRMAVLVAAGAFAIKPPIYYVRQSQGFMVPASAVAKIEGLLQSFFGKPFQVQFYNISQLAENSSNKLNAAAIQSINYFMQNKEQSVAQNRAKLAHKSIESRLEKGWINPLALRDSSRVFKSFSNLAYFLDLLMVMLYTSVYSSSDLLADVLVRSLLRNMKRHKQVLNAVSTIITHFRSFENWPFKPLDWCLAFHGKIGSGTVRSRSHYIKTGFLPLQTVNFPVDYAYRQVDTKFGSIGIKIWLRRHVA
jgi:hypothetical protein